MNQTKSKQTKNVVLACLALVLALSLSLSGVLVLFNTSYATSYLNVDVTERHQTFEGWGTSLAWWANAVGGWTMEGASGKTKREEIVDLLFGADGLNFNIVRYNIPGGENPSHNHMKDYRQMPTVKEDSTSAYKWSADDNQLWVLRAANALRNEVTNGNSDIINEVFSNSAPYWMTESGCVSGGAYADEQNLAAENFAKFAEYIADYVDYLQNTLGIDVHYVEPLNEAGSDYWAANGTQEGMRVYAGDNQSQLILAVYNELVSRGIVGSDKKTQLTGLDETNTALSVENWNMLSESAKQVLSKINTHLYSHSVDDQEQLFDLAYGAHGDYENPQCKLWMSEVAYGADAEPSVTDMKYAMELAFDVQENLNVMGASAWIYWQAVESTLQNMMYGNNYGLIHGVFQDDDNDYGIDTDGLGMSRGDYELTKQYYALGQYSRYIGQGYKIVYVDDNVTDDVKVRNVAALSPDGTKLVIVTTNGGGEEPARFYLKDFNATSCQKVVTTESKNWQTSDVAVNGSYLNDTLEEQSITTYVLSGNTVDEPADDSGVYLNGFVTRDGGMYAQYYIADSAAEYKLYYSTDKSALPVYGGTSADSVTLTSNEGEHVYKRQGLSATDDYYAVVEKTQYGDKYYSAVLCGKTKSAVTDDFVYFTSCGKTDKTALSGVGSMGAYYGLADQKFDYDPFGGMRWGLVSEAEEYNSDDVFTACRYTENADNITYKYELPDGETLYDVCLGFKDPWETSDRYMDVYVNGAFVGKVEGTKYFTTSIFTDVHGVYDSSLGGYFVTVEVRQSADSSQKPALNFVTIQSKTQTAKNLGVAQPSAIALIQGEALTDKLPKKVDILNTKGSTESYDLSFTQIQAEDLLTSGGGTGRVFGVENSTGMTFEINVGATDPSVQVYYYIDCGATDLTGDLAATFEGIKRANESTLVNKDALDKTCSSAYEWGRVGNYSVFWQNDPDKFNSVVEGDSIRYWLVGLAAGKYTVEVGVNIHGWNISDRAMSFKMGDTLLGEVADYNDKDVFNFQYDKTDDGGVMFECTSKGSEKPLLAYLIVKRVVESGTATEVSSPELDNAVSDTDKTIKVTNLTLGALLMLRDDQGNLIADKVVTEADVAAGEIVFSNVDLSQSKRIEAVQYLRGKTGSMSVADIPRLTLSAPRESWSTAADVIQVSASSEVGIDKIEYKFGDDGQWTDIKTKKFIRAEQNGTYFVKLVTRAGVEVVKSVDVTKVDRVDIASAANFVDWTDGDIDLDLNIVGTNDITSVKVQIGNDTIDITDSFDGKYHYAVGKNCTASVTVTTSCGGVVQKVFEVGNIDKGEVKLAYKLLAEGGVTRAVLSAESISQTTYYCTYADGAEIALNAPEVVLAYGGRYVFKVVNGVGKTASIVVVYDIAKVGDKTSVVETQKTDDGVVVSVASNARLYRLDGDGEEISLTNGKATLTQNGKYRVVSTDGETHIVDFYVDEFASQNNVGGGGKNASSSLAWLWFAASGVLLVAASVTLFVFVLKGKKRTTSEVKNDTNVH